MNSESLQNLLRKLVQSESGLREIDPELQVPWSWAQWLICCLCVSLCGLLVLQIAGQLRRRRAPRAWTTPDLLRELERIEENRLRRISGHAEALIQLEQLVRLALQRLDQNLGGHGHQRATQEWLVWLEEQHCSTILPSVKQLMTRADHVKFAEGNITLADVRQAALTAREVILKADVRLPPSRSRLG